MKLYFRDFGRGYPLVVLHGLYGCSDNWLTVARELSARFRVIVPDLRNHGRSPHSPEHSYAAMASDVLELLDDLAVGPCFLMGHSMGGKVAIHVACRSVDRIAKLVVVDIAPFDDASLTELSPLVREHWDLADALLHIDLRRYTRREEVERQCADRIPDIRTRRFLLKNLQRDDTEGFRWRMNIDVLVQNLPTILNGMDALGLGAENRRDVPVLFVKGERSAYLPTTMFARIRQAFPHAQMVTVADAGHWLHVEHPSEFMEAVVGFLSVENAGNSDDGRG